MVQLNAYKFNLVDWIQSVVVSLWPVCDVCECKKRMCVMEYLMCVSGWGRGCVTGARWLRKWLREDSRSLKRLRSRACTTSPCWVFCLPFKSIPICHLHHTLSRQTESALKLFHLIYFLSLFKTAYKDCMVHFHLSISDSFFANWTRYYPREWVFW